MRCSQRGDALFEFLRDVLLRNALEFAALVDLRAYLVTVFEDMEYEVLDESVVREFLAR